MAQAYKAAARTLHFGDREGETVYSATPVSYGTLDTDDVARQIAAESTASPGDVKAVLDRYAYYVIENLKKGYSIELLGFGYLYIRFITSGTVSKESEVKASLIKALMPGFRPSYTMVNGTRIYNLIPDKISLVKYNGSSTDTESNEGESEDENTGENEDGNGNENNNGDENS